MSDWVYRANVIDVYDGDTITIDLDMGMRVWQKAVKVRLAGVDAPEVRGAERPQGLVARDTLRALLPVGTEVGIVSHSFEKYGRLLATVTVAETNVNEYMAENGYAGSI